MAPGVEAQGADHLGSDRTPVEEQVGRRWIQEPPARVVAVPWRHPGPVGEQLPGQRVGGEYVGSTAEYERRVLSHRGYQLLHGRPYTLREWLCGLVPYRTGEVGQVGAGRRLEPEDASQRFEHRL